MATGQPTLATFYEGWDRYQTLLVEAVQDLTPNQLWLGVSKSLRPAWVLAAHIISARVHWFHRVLREGDASLAPMIAWDDEGQPQRSGAELADGLTRSWQLIDACLQCWTPELLDDTFTTPRGSIFSRQWVIWHVIEHDLHHGGELFFTLGTHGLPTPDL